MSGFRNMRKAFLAVIVACALLAPVYANAQIGQQTGIYNGSGGGAGGGATVNVKGLPGGGGGDGVYTAGALMQHGTSASPTAPAQTTITANDLVVSVIGAAVTGTFTAPVAPTPRADTGHASSYELWAGDLLQASPGLTSAQSGTITSNDWHGATIMLAPTTGQSVTFINKTTCTVASGGMTRNVPSGTLTGHQMLL